MAKGISKAGEKSEEETGSLPLPGVIKGPRKISRESIITEVRRMFRRMDPLGWAQRAALVTGLVRAFYSYGATVNGIIEPGQKLLENVSLDLELDVRHGAERRLYELRETKGPDYARAVVLELVTYVLGHTAYIVEPMLMNAMTPPPSPHVEQAEGF